MMKILDFEVIKETCGNIDTSEFLSWVNDAFVKKNEYVMPVKTRLNQQNGNYFAVMPCINDKYAMVKMIGRHELKDGEKRATMMSDMLVYESDTGILKAVMDGEYITTLRTGSVAAHAAITYCKEYSSIIGCIGLGNIMTVCLDVLLGSDPKRNWTVKLHKYHNNELRIIQRYSKYSNVKFVVCDSYEETITDSDIIFSAVTRVTENFCDDSVYKEGCTVIPIMTMGFQNCDLFFDKIFTDEINQIRNFKYFNKFKSLSNTTDVLLKLKKGRESNTERILVYNYGLAIHDLYFASKILDTSNKFTEIEYNYCKEKYFM